MLKFEFMLKSTSILHFHKYKSTTIFEEGCKRKRRIFYCFKILILFFGSTVFLRISAAAYLVFGILCEVLIHNLNQNNVQVIFSEPKVRETSMLVNKKYIFSL